MYSTGDPSKMALYQNQRQVHEKDPRLLWRRIEEFPPGRMGMVDPPVSTSTPFCKRHAYANGFMYWVIPDRSKRSPSG